MGAKDYKVGNTSKTNWNPTRSSVLKKYYPDLVAEYRRIAAEEKLEKKAKIEALKEEKAYIEGLAQRKETADALAVSRYANKTAGYSDDTSVRFVPHIIGKLRVSRLRQVRLREDEQSFKRIWKGIGGQRHNVFILHVGVLDKSEVHDGEASKLTYKDLFEILASLGYDPLYPFQNEGFREKINRELGDIILRSMQNPRINNLAYIRKQFSKVGERLVSVIRSYIKGGDKPALAPATIKTRKSRKKMHSDLYKSGIDAPLVETGALMNAVSYKVETYHETLEDYSSGQSRRTRYTKLDTSTPAIHYFEKKASENLDVGSKEMWKFEKSRALFARKKGSVNDMIFTHRDFENEIKDFVRDRGKVIEKQLKGARAR